MDLITKESKTIATTQTVTDEPQDTVTNAEVAASACALCLCCTAIIALCAMGSSTSIGSIDVDDDDCSGCCICCLCCCDTSVPTTRQITTNQTETVIVKQKRFLVVSLVVCQQIVAFYDTNHDISLSLNEVTRFSEDFQRWQSSFEIFDREKRGKILASKLKAALAASYLNDDDYRVNDFIHKYGDSEGIIWITEFLACVLEMKNSK